MYHALSVARYIIDFCNERGKGISNLKLQKILYFVQAEFLVSTPHHTSCFKDEIEAWDFGPVVPNVYHQYKIYGSGIIPSNLNDTLFPFYEKISFSDRTIINDVIEAAENYSASQLVEITHKQSPWKNAYNKGFNNKITNEAILDFFER